MGKVFEVNNKSDSSSIGRTDLKSRRIGRLNETKKLMLHESFIQDESKSNMKLERELIRQLYQNHLPHQSRDYYWSTQKNFWVLTFCSTIQSSKF